MYKGHYWFIFNKSRMYGTRSIHLLKSLASVEFTSLAFNLIKIYSFDCSIVLKGH